MTKNIFSISLVGSLGLTVFLLLPAIVFAQNLTPSPVNQEAYDAIKAAEDSMTVTDGKLTEIEHNGSLPASTDPIMQVSVNEISNKLQASRTLLDQSVEAFQGLEYSKATILAVRSKQNTLLTNLYLEALLNRASGLGISQLNLQGTLADLFKLRQLLTANQPIIPLVVLPVVNTATTTTSVPAPIEPKTPTSTITTNTSTTSIPSNTNIASSTIPETASSTTPTPIVPVPLPPKVVTCIDKAIAVCKTQQDTCVTKANQTPNKCQALFDSGMVMCQRYSIRSETYANKCQDTLKKCLIKNPKRQIICQTEATICQAKATISRDHDLAAVTTCQKRQTDRKASCEASYATQISALVGRCANTYTTCDSNSRTRCLTTAKPVKPKATAKP